MGKVVAKHQIRRNRILRTLLDNGPMSLTELAKLTGIRLPMVSHIVSEGIRKKLLINAEGKRPSGSGRPPVVVGLNGRAGYVVGIDLGHRNTNVVLIDLQQNIVVERRVPSPPLTDNQALIRLLATELDSILRDGEASRRLLRGVGISIPGYVRAQDGVSETYLNFGARGTRDVLRDELQTPVHIEHDAQAMALGEKWFGAARKTSHALCLNIGWGLGLGVLIDGRILTGHDGYPPEFGHIQAVPNGRLCYCGKRGCLETVASGMAIGREARERLAAGAVSRLQDMVGGRVEEIDAEKVAQAAMTGDQFSMDLLEEVGRFIGEGVAILVNLFVPERIILNGRVSLAGDFILGPIRSTAMKKSVLPLASGVEFVISNLGAKAGTLGVAMLAARDLFEVEHLNPSALV
jgi:glucokinase-like ROK family protein